MNDSSANSKTKEKSGAALLARSFERYSLISELSFAPEGQGDEVELRTQDFSEKGMFIHTTMNLPEGTVVKVKFRLRRSGFLVKARGEVRYSLPGVGIGVEFVGISPETENAIRAALSNESSGSSK